MIHRKASLLMLLPLILVAAACDQSSTASITDDTKFSNIQHADFNGDLEHSKEGAQLAEVRRHTAHFQDAEKAEDAGYLPTSECVEISGVGGMGYHYVDPYLFAPPEELDITKPQAILYEPQKNERLRLVGVEYIVPEIILDSNGPAPMLFGEQFHWNPDQKHWALHVWLWRNNPTGMFADWNPKVNCDYAPDHDEQ